MRGQVCTHQGFVEKNGATIAARSVRLKGIAGEFHIAKKKIIKILYQQSQVFSDLDNVCCS